MFLKKISWKDEGKIPKNYVENQANNNNKVVLKHILKVLYTLIIREIPKKIHWVNHGGIYLELSPQGSTTKLEMSWQNDSSQCNKSWDSCHRKTEVSPPPQPKAESHYLIHLQSSCYYNYQNYRYAHLTILPSLEDFSLSFKTQV